MLTKQEYLDRLLAACEDGTFPSVGFTGGCAYRADETATCKQRCAVGLLISDDKYESVMDSGNYSLSRLCKEDVVEPVEGFGVNELRIVQMYHDDISNVRGVAFRNAFVWRLQRGGLFNGCVFPSSSPSPTFSSQEEENKLQGA